MAVASLEKIAVTIVPGTERVGIVLAVYYSGLPFMVAGFAGRLDNLVHLLRSHLRRF